MRRALLAGLALLGAACGGTPDEPVARTHEQWVAYAAAVTGADLSGVTVHWIEGSSLASIGHPDSIGWTAGSDVYVLTTHPDTLIHEALHVKLGGASNGHCAWSADYLGLFDRERVWGSFTDDCAQVHCVSDGDGQNWACR